MPFSVAEKHVPVLAGKTLWECEDFPQYRQYLAWESDACLVARIAWNFLPCIVLFKAG